MPRAKEHINAGQIIGGIAAGVTGPEGDPVALIIEILGGIFGGNIGARIPDIIDPPNHGGHRGFGHGMMPNTAIVASCAEGFCSTRIGLREVAKEAMNEYRETGEIWPLLKYVACHFSVGTMTGIAAGHVTHLVQDAQTPARLPFVA